MDITRIEQNDKVDVFFNNVPWEADLKVLYTPCSAGEYWELIRPDGTPLNIQNFDKMVLKEKAPEPPPVDIPF